MKRLEVLLWAAVLAGFWIASAPAAELVLELPTEYEDGAPLAPADIVGTVLYCGNELDGERPEVWRGPGGTEHRFELALAPGHWFCSVRVLARNGTTSPPSPHWEFDVRPPDLPPNSGRPATGPIIVRLVLELVSPNER